MQYNEVNPKATEVAESHLPQQEVDRLLEGRKYDPTRLVNEVRDYLSQAACNMFEAGKRLLVLREKEKWGDFERMIRRDIGITPRYARNLMGIAIKFSNRKSISDLLNKTKLIAALELPDEELDRLETEGHLIGIPKAKLKLLSVREFKAEIQQWKHKSELSEEEVVEENKETDEIQENLEPLDEEQQYLTGLKKIESEIIGRLLHLSSYVAHRPTSLSDAVISEIETAGGTVRRKAEEIFYSILNSIETEAATLESPLVQHLQDQAVQESTERRKVEV